MRIDRSSAVIATMAILTAAASAALFAQLPSHIPVHWNHHGRPDGWGEKSWAAFVLPLMIVGVFLLGEVMPRLRRSGATLAPFLGTFRYVLLVTAGLLAYLHGIALITAIHPQWDLARPLMSGILLAMGLIGNVMGKVRRNPYVGIRTPWTLASDAVWVPTHRLAAHLLFAVGLLGAIVVWFGVPPSMCLGAIIGAALVPAGYSWLLYERMESV